MISDEEKAVRHWVEEYMEIEILRKIADAAVADAIVNGAYRKLGHLPLIDQKARLIVCEASMYTAEALGEAVREYRKLKEGEE